MEVLELISIFLNGLLPRGRVGGVVAGGFSALPGDAMGVNFVCTKPRTEDHGTAPNVSGIGDGGYDLSRHWNVGSLPQTWVPRGGWEEGHVAGPSSGRKYSDAAYLDALDVSLQAAHPGEVYVVKVCGALMVEWMGEGGRAMKAYVVLTIRASDQMAASLHEASELESLVSEVLEKMKPCLESRPPGPYAPMTVRHVAASRAGSIVKAAHFSWLFARPGLSHPAVQKLQQQGSDQADPRGRNENKVGPNAAGLLPRRLLPRGVLSRGTIGEQAASGLSALSPADSVEVHFICTQSKGDAHFIAPNVGESVIESVVGSAVESVVEGLVPGGLVALPADAMEREGQMQGDSPGSQGDGKSCSSLESGENRDAKRRVNAGTREPPADDASRKHPVEPLVIKAPSDDSSNDQPPSAIEPREYNPAGAEVHESQTAQGLGDAIGVPLESLTQSRAHTGAEGPGERNTSVPYSGQQSSPPSLTEEAPGCVGNAQCVPPRQKSGAVQMSAVPPHGDDTGMPPRSPSPGQGRQPIRRDPEVGARGPRGSSGAAQMSAVPPHGDGPGTPPQSPHLRQARRPRRRDSEEGAKGSAVLDEIEAGAVGPRKTPRRPQRPRPRLPAVCRLASSSHSEGSSDNDDSHAKGRGASTYAVSGQGIAARETRRSCPMPLRLHLERYVGLGSARADDLVRTGSPGAPGVGGKVPLRSALKKASPPFQAHLEHKKTVSFDDKVYVKSLAIGANVGGTGSFSTSWSASNGDEWLEPMRLGGVDEAPVMAQMCDFTPLTGQTGYSVNLNLDCSGPLEELNGNRAPMADMSRTGMKFLQGGADLAYTVGVLAVGSCDAAPNDGEGPRQLASDGTRAQNCEARSDIMNGENAPHGVDCISEVQLSHGGIVNPIRGGHRRSKSILIKSPLFENLVEDGEEAHDDSCGVVDLQGGVNTLKEHRRSRSMTFSNAMLPSAANEHMPAGEGVWAPKRYAMRSPVAIIEVAD